MAKPKRRRSQPRVKGGRDPLWGSVLPTILAALDTDARAYGVSRSWVLATIVADHYGIRTPDFRIPSTLRLVR